MNKQEKNLLNYLKENKTSYEMELDEAAKIEVEAWFRKNNWVPTEGKVIPSIDAFKAGAAWQKQREEKLVEALRFIYKQVDSCAYGINDKWGTVMESVYRTAQQNLKSHEGGSNE